MNNQDKFNEYRKKYPTFIYESYDVQFDKAFLYIKGLVHQSGITGINICVYTRQITDSKICERKIDRTR